MKWKSTPTDIDWARRVNRSWLVHGGLGESAETWLQYLSSLDDGRLARSCATARGMCRMRDPMEDPKPWFYAGLFSLATKPEAIRFLEKHRITLATIPSLTEEAEVAPWLNAVAPETRSLLDRVRKALAESSHTS